MCPVIREPTCESLQPQGQTSNICRRTQLYISVHRIHLPTESRCDFISQNGGHISLWASAGSPDTYINIEQVIVCLYLSFPFEYSLILAGDHFPLHIDDLNMIRPICPNPTWHIWPKFLARSHSQKHKEHHRLCCMRQA